jgi:hemin uptake protein HemP
MKSMADKREYKRLDFSKLNFSDKDITTEEALRDVVPFLWSEEVLQEEKKVIIKKTEDK